MKKLKHYNILIAEDEALLRQSLVNNINSLDSGFKVICQVSNGEEALRYLKTNTIHLLITDIRMPVMDGLTLAKCVHEQYPHVFTVVLTGYADFGYAREALKQRIFDYLLKPVSGEDLESTLSRVRLHLQKHYELEEDPDLVGKDAEEIVEYTVLYMREHYMDNIDISSFASANGFTSSYLTKLFNRYKGDTPSKYLTDIRIHEAKRLLTDTTLPIREVGEHVGYPDQFHFSKTFRKHIGVNPSAYRKEKQQ